MNLFPHSSHSYGFSPVWVLLQTATASSFLALFLLTLGSSVSPSATSSGLSSAAAVSAPLLLPLLTLCPSPSSVSPSTTSSAVSALLLLLPLLTLCPSCSSVSPSRSGDVSSAAAPWWTSSRDRVFFLLLEILLSLVSLGVATSAARHVKIQCELCRQSLVDVGWVPVPVPNCRALGC